MNPAFLDDMSWEMAEVYGAVTDQILVNLAHYFPYWKPGQPVPKSSFEYQAVMLAQMGKVNRDTVQIIAKGLNGADGALANVLKQAIMEAVNKAEPKLLLGVTWGFIHPSGQPKVAPNQMHAFQLYYQQAAQKLNLVNTVMLESTQQAYQSTVADIANRIQATQTALDIGAGETITGVSSWNQAMRHSIDRMKANGITGFIDHAGRRWSAEAYTAMDIRTTVANTARAAIWETNQSFGNDLYQVSYHDGARPLCYPWQNKVISSTDNARTVKDLDANEIHVYAQSETSYGQAAGLFGINCKHYPSPFIPGVSIIRGEPQNEEDNAKTYAESQEQRRLERKVREEKRDLMMLKAQGAPDDMIAAQQARVRSASADIQDFCDQTGRARHRDREGVYTERKFPAAETYDVSTFEQHQKELINKYFTGGGTQSGYTFGEMVPKQPILPRDTFTIKDAIVTTEKDRIICAGSTSQTVLKSATVYKMPDGVEFVFKDGMIKAQQRMTPEVLIKKYYEIPKAIRAGGAKTISVVDRYNPADAYWRAEYKKLGYKFQNSYMTGGNEITLWRYDYEHDMDYVLFSLQHEAGHLIDIDNDRISETTEWLDAIAADKALSGKASWRAYGATRTPEDFADSVGYFGTQNEEFRKLFPNRTKILEMLLGVITQ